MAIASAQGTEESSFKLLSLYFFVLETANSGTVTHIETELDERGLVRIKYAFMALGASITGWNHVRKVVVLDGTHLLGKYKGVLLTASGQDANFQVFPVAFAVVDSENDDSWRWFLEKLSKIIEDSSDLTIISDRHGSIYTAKDDWYPQSHHGACLVLLQRNVQGRYGGKGMKAMVERAGQVFRVSQFKRVYANIKKRDVRVWEYLEEIGVQHWSRAHFKGKRYNLMSSNILKKRGEIIRSRNSG